MPQGEDGKPIDVLLNSMSVTSRVAPGLITTMALGKIAKKTGKNINITPFVKGSSVEQTIAALKKHGIKDTEKVYDPISGRTIEVFTGPSYYTRLHHIAEDKISARSAGTTYDINMQPSKSGSLEKSKRLGNLATTVALSNDAREVLKDVAVVRGTKNDDFWTAIKLGYAPPPPKVPFIFNKFISHLEGSGVHVHQDGPKFNILPQTDKDIEKISEGEITSPLTYKLKAGELVAETGGLFDPVNTGIYGDKYNHISLAAKIPNPISEEPLRKLMGVTKAKFETLLSTGELEKTLSKLDIDKKMDELKGYIKSNKKTGRDDAVKVLSFLTMLKRNGRSPKDLLISKVPVIPAQYRPIVAQGNQIMSADVNELYKDLMLVNKSLEGVDKDTPEELKAEATKKLYEGVRAVYGLGEPVSTRSKEKGFKGLLATTLGTQGGSAKSSMFQAKVVNKPIDLVGRGVLVPDGNLNLNEAAIPQSILWSIYTPFIMRRLVRQGVPATKARDYVKNKHPLANQMLQEELKDRPGIITRDPQLSKYNFQGFYLKANPDPKDFSIKLNPLVFKGYGADSDGDQLNVQVPAGDEAKEEVKAKLFPEKNLIYHRTFSPIYTPSNESAVGLFAASYEDNKNQPVKYSNPADVVKDFLSGKLDVGDRVELS
jgi:DNA-directed RNA polymerase subunit beta'